MNALVWLVALGAIFAVGSELWFYEVALNFELATLLLAYGLCAVMMMAVLTRWPPRDIWGVYLGGAVFGLLIEGIVVPTVYVLFPFQMIWTPLAWHALLTVLVGWWVYRRVMATGIWWHAAALNLSIGVFVGLWSAYLWNADESGAELVWTWQPTRAFAVQMGAGLAAFVGAHLLLDVAARWPARMPAWVIWALGGLITLVFCTAWLPAYFPVSLAPPVVIAVTLWALARGQGDGAWFGAAMALQVPRARYLWALLILGGAVGAYHLIATLQLPLEMNLPVAGITVPVSLVMWFYALWRGLRAG